MSNQVAPKQTPQKKQISQKEYDHWEEWAPETIKDYQVSSGRPVPVTVHQKRHQPQHQPSQQQNQPQTTSASIIQGRIPNRRSQVRSSSLFEEWKTKALRNPVQLNEPIVSPTTTLKQNNETEGVTCGEARKRPLGKRVDEPDNFQAKIKPTNDSCDRQPATTKADGFNSETPSSVTFSGTQSDPFINPTATIRKKASKRGRKQDRPERQQQHSKVRGQKQPAYVSPNGTHFDAVELRQLALGVRLEGKDVVYFLPCFIEDPWKDMKPSPYAHPAELKNRS